MDGIIYLMIAVETAHKINSNSSTFVQESSNFPTLASCLEDGGVGFDYRIYNNVVCRTFADII